MNKGDYVRNKYGITKIIDIENNNGIDVLVFDKPICFLVNKETGEIKDDKLFNKLAIIDGIDINKIKSSPNIIDILEVGDYVNGKKVEWIGYGLYKENEDKTLTGIGEKIILFNEFTKDSVKEKSIMTIVTKEQFSSMEYKVESEVK